MNCLRIINAGSFPRLTAVLFFLLSIVSLLIVPSPRLHAQDGFYYRASFHFSVNPVTAGFVKRAITRAENDGAEALILTLDTPGGLMQSMKDITDRILESGLPVIVWIGPGNAHAASAGVFITYAAHVSAISTGSSLGAAHPVSGGGQQMDETMKEKVVNISVADLKGLARKRDRNETMAEKFIRESVALNAREAVEKNVVDFLADSEQDLLDALNGRTVIMDDGRTVTLDGDLPVRPLPMTWKEEFLNTLVNPNLVYILLILGIYGLIYEFANPGIGLGAVAGGICLLLALYGLSVLPVNYAGLGLLFLGIGLLILEVFVPSFGVLTLGGISSLVLGSVFLFQTEAFAVSWGLIVGVSLSSAVFILLIGYLFAGAVFREPIMGDRMFVGEEGVVKKDLDPEGMVHVRGEYWTARATDDRTLRTGERIRVVKKGERRLLVEPVEQESVSAT